MSMLKNCVKTQHTHRERAQPHDRKHLGQLEKKKDYRLRAANTNEKKEALKILRQKALEKNPDEFQYKMINSRLVNGEHTERWSDSKKAAEGEGALSKEQVALMQTQDINYINSKQISEKRKLEKLQSRLHLISSDKVVKNKHMIFVDSEKEKRTLDLATRLDTHPALLDRAYNRPRVKDLKTGKFSTHLDPEEAKKLRKQTAKMYRELEQRMDRDEKLSVLQRKMQIRAILKSEKNKPTRKLREETPNAAPVYKWAYQRKK